MTDMPADAQADRSDQPDHEDWVNEIEVRGLIVGAFQENCWVIGNRRTREAICIDPGEQADDIIHLAKDMGVEIKLIAASHGHLDHVLGIRGVQSASGAGFLMHEHDLDILRGAAASAAQFGMQVEQPPDPNHYIAERDVVEVDGVRLETIHTPGHTRGSVSFFGHGILFSGDTLFRQSIGRTDLPGGDYAQEMSSIVDKLLQLPDETIVLPGHMDQTTLGDERRQNPFILQTLQQRGVGPGERLGPGGLILPE